MFRRSREIDQYSSMVFTLAQRMISSTKIGEGCQDPPSPPNTAEPASVGAENVLMRDQSWNRCGNRPLRELFRDEIAPRKLWHLHRAKVHPRKSNELYSSLCLHIPPLECIQGRETLAVITRGRCGIRHSLFKFRSASIPIGRSFSHPRDSVLYRHILFLSMGKYPVNERSS